MKEQNQTMIESDYDYLIKEVEDYKQRDAIELLATALRLAPTLMRENPLLLERWFQQSMDIGVDLGAARELINAETAYRQIRS